MRSLSVSFAAHLASNPLKLAECVLLSPLVGTPMGFTSLNRDLLIDGVTYEAGTWAEMSSMSATRGSGVDNIETSGILSSDNITESDIIAGVYDGAKIELFQVVWSNLSYGKFIVLTGVLGEISHTGTLFNTEFRSLSQFLSQNIVDLTSPVCRVRQLFDAKCFVNGTNYDETFVPGDFRFLSPVSAVVSSRQITFGGPTTPVNGEIKATGYYDYGIVLFTTGLNAGYSRDVKSHILNASLAEITLQESFPFTVAVSDIARLEAGCDRLSATCTNKYANIGNYRGEPHLPGSEAILKRGRK